jgi:DNA repair exonuclease SbcCD nuclease subunit
MTAHLSGDLRRRRRAELLHTFTRMVNYAAEHEVAAILICGDLFDTKNISAQAANTVFETIAGNPQIIFYYLPGNHEEQSFAAWMPAAPGNLKIFGHEWTVYRQGGVSIEGTDAFAGMEVPPASAENNENDTRIGTCRIVALHGQLSAYGNAEPETLNLQKLRNKGIDYLALGHVHTYKRGELPYGGIWCYAGALEGRGFDECGPHGFVLLDIDDATGKVTDTFIPFASRMLWDLSVDITGAETTVGIIGRVEERLAAESMHANDMVRITLQGSVDVCAEKNLMQIRTHFGDRYALVQIRDESVLQVDYRSFENDASLKGELVRLLQRESELSDGEKAEIARCGLQALSGEEFEF